MARLCASCGNATKDAQGLCSYCRHAKGDMRRSEQQREYDRERMADKWSHIKSAYGESAAFIRTAPVDEVLKAVGEENLEPAKVQSPKMLRSRWKGVEVHIGRGRVRLPKAPFVPDPKAQELAGEKGCEGSSCAVEKRCIEQEEAASEGEEANRLF